MPKLKSAKKRLVTSQRALARNRAIRSRMRSAIKAVDQAADRATAEGALSQAYSTIDRTAKKGVIHKNMAARYKGRLTKRVQKMD